MTLIDQLLSFTDDKTTLLAEIHHQGELMSLHQQDNFRWLYSSGCAIQSILCLDAPERLDLLHQNIMLIALLLIEEPKRILNLGFGGGSFERFFGAKQTDLTMVSVDINPELVKLAKQYLQIPDHCSMIIQQAELYLQTEQQTFQLILCDIFNGVHHASCLNEPDFYRHSANRLTENGVMAINLAPKSDTELIAIVNYARRFFVGVMLSLVADQGNIVILLSKQALPAEHVLKDKAAGMAKRWSLDFTELLSGFNRLSW